MDGLYNHDRMFCVMCNSRDCIHVVDRTVGLSYEQRKRLNDQLIARENKKLKEEVEKLKNVTCALPPIADIGQTITVSNGSSTSIFPVSAADLVFGSVAAPVWNDKYEPKDKRLLLVS